MYSKRELLNWLWELGDGPESPPTMKDLDNHEVAPSPATYSNRFESWEQALRDAGFDEMAVLSRMEKRDYTRAELLRILKQAADKFGEPLTKSAYSQLEGGPAPSTIEREFGSWNAALDEAGIQVALRRDRDATWYDDDELLAHLRDVAAELGRRPSQQDINEREGPAHSTYVHRFGSWKRALELAFPDE